MKVVFDFIYSFLEEGLNFTEREYREYYENIVNQTEEQQEKDKIELHRKQGLLKNVAREIKEIGLGLVKSKFTPPNIKYANVLMKLDED